MLTITVLAIFAGIAFLSPLNVQSMRKYSSIWKQHKVQYNLDFDEVENTKRFQIFLGNAQKIEEINSKNLTFTCKMNKFGHWSRQEYIDYVSNRVEVEEFTDTDSAVVGGDIQDLPDVDWRAKGYLTNVKDQGSCGSCFAFSTICQLESQYAMKTGKNVSLSAQDIVDCSFTFGNGGCDGGHMYKAFNYVKEIGINSENEYPYKAYVGACKHDSTKNVLKVTKYTRIRSQDQNALEQALVNFGPVTVAIDASSFEFAFYDTGVYTDYNCGSSHRSLGHAVMAVGVGSKPSRHFIVRNSWGNEYGDEGYILMSREQPNICGIATDAAYAEIEVISK